MKYYEVYAYDYTHRKHENTFVFANNKKTALIHGLNKFQSTTALFIFTPFVFDWIEQLLSVDSEITMNRLHDFILGATNVAVYVDELIEVPILSESS